MPQNQTLTGRILSRRAPGTAPRCETMLGRPGGGIMPDWPVEADKCMEPAAVIMAFRCPYGHSGQLAKCEPHARDDGTQKCGLCAFARASVPVEITIVRRL